MDYELPEAATILHLLPTVVLILILLWLLRPKYCCAKDKERDGTASTGGQTMTPQENSSGVLQDNHHSQQRNAYKRRVTSKTNSDFDNVIARMSKPKKMWDAAICETPVSKETPQWIEPQSVPQKFGEAFFVPLDIEHIAETRHILERTLAEIPRPCKHECNHNTFDASRIPYVNMGSETLERERASLGYKQMLPERSRLPAFRMARQICLLVREGPVTLILGATGCGKTTQVPQLLLEDAVARGEECRIFASQPRRLSAVSVAERVSRERGGQLGGTVAYKIRFEDTVTEGTQLIFCTVGILLKMMQNNPMLEGATHIIVDEVHERNLETDFLLTLLRRIIAHRKHLRIILMSATVDPKVFQTYFPLAHTLTIPGRTNHPIKELFLEDILQILPDRSLWRQGRAARAPRASMYSQDPLSGVPLDPQGVLDALPSLSWEIASDIAFFHSYPPDDVDFEIVQKIVEMAHINGDDGGILIFMPGWFEITEIIKRLVRSAIRNDLDIHALHSRIPTTEQQIIFQPSPHGKRKVVVSTILAETSITVEDIVIVIDTGLSRDTYYNEVSKVPALRTLWYSKANGFQRRGRSGRNRPGTWYRVFSSLQWEALEEHSPPEMLRSPLEQVCLQIASLHLGSPLQFLAEAITPPREEMVKHAIDLLCNIGALRNPNGTELTPLGEKLTKLQVHPTLGKLLLVANLFGCCQPMLTICACLSYKSPFLCPGGKEKEASLAKRRLARHSKSDLLALVYGYNAWCTGGVKFAEQNFLSNQTLEYIHCLRQDLQRATEDTLAPMLDSSLAPTDLDSVCRAVLVASLFPNIAWIKAKGKGQTIQGVNVAIHPSSVNSREQNCVTVFYDIQETTDRWLYDTTVVSMLPCLMFAPHLKDISWGRRVNFHLGQWVLAVDALAVEDLMAVRSLLVEFIGCSVGQTPTVAHTRAIAVLRSIFSRADLDLNL